MTAHNETTVGGTAIPGAQLLALLSLAQDSAFGQPLESELRTCLLSVWLAEALGCSSDERSDTYYAALLRYVGCTGHAHETAAIFGDEIEARARSALYDASNPAEMLLEIVKHAGEGKALPERLRILSSVLAAGRRGAADGFRAGCEVADRLADRLGMSARVRAALACTFERWSGTGYPNGVRGDAIPRAMRIVHLTQEMEALERFGGVASSVALARKRAGRAYDPAIVEVFAKVAGEIFARLARASAWDDVLSIDPAPRVLSDGGLDEALLVIADFVDAKSPFTLGHSRGVGELAAGAAAACGLDAAEQKGVLRAGYLHDLGRCGIPNSIWDKPALLTRTELDRVRIHSLLGDQMLARLDVLARVRAIAAADHERWDGSGYHRGMRAPQPPLPARILACADVYHAMTEPRPTRPARPVEEAARELRAEGARGALDRDAVEAVLAAAGHRARPVRKGAPCGLTDREVEVLTLVARGFTTKEVASRLGISAKTADHHIQSVYGKIGVTTRAAAALFAAQTGLA